MSVNSTIALTLILLSLMIGAGVVSAAWGYALGREALKGITQPDVRPVSSLGETEAMPARHEGQVTILREADILADVKSRVGGGRETPPSGDSSTESNSQSKAFTEAPSTEVAAEVSTTRSQLEMPMTSQDRGVTLEVSSVYQQGNALVMDVNLQNQGSRPVKFLYSFMRITDNQGRSFTANTAGLPGELPPNGQLFSGEVSIPISLLDGSENLDLKLTDYPDQHLQLQLSGIPIVR